MADAVEIDGIYYNLITKGKVAEVTRNPNNYSGNVIIPDKITYEETEFLVTNIGLAAFEWSSELTSIAIPNSITTIGNEAFYGCRSLTTIIIPNSVTSIGQYVFQGCYGLTSVELPNSITSVTEGTFMNCTSLTSIIIPSSVTSIGYKSFAGCSNLESITIPNSVTSIGQYAFLSCTGLTSIIFPSSLTTIDGWAFWNCTGLTSVTFPSSLTTISNSAFRECAGLISITLGCGTRSIGLNAFASCPELTDIYCYAENVPFTNTLAFEGSYIDYTTLHVPDASIDLYKAAEPWKNFKEIVGLSGTTPETQKCATPTIQIVDGKLKLSCETEGVTFVTSYTSDGLSDSVLDDEIVLAGTTTCHVSVYATKEGYENSDVATVDVELHIGKKGDVNADGVVDITDAVGVVNILLEKNEQNITQRAPNV